MTTPSAPPASRAAQDTWDLARGAFANLIGMAARSARLLATIAATNLFGAAVFGLCDTAWKVTFVFLKVACFGLQQGLARAVVRSRAAGRQDEAERAIGAGLSLAVVMGLVAAATVWLAAGPLHRYYEQPELATALRVMAWALPFMALSAVLIAATRALRIMKYDVYVNSIGGPLVALAGTLAAGLAGWGLAGLAGVQVLTGIGVFLLSVVFFRSRFSLRACLGAAPGKAPWRPLALFSLPVMLSDVVTTAVWSLDQFILLKWAPAATVGVYAVARQLSTFMKKAPQAFDPILGAIAADLAYHRRTEELSDHLAFQFRWVLTVNCAYLGVLWLAGDRLLRVFGAAFAEGLGVLAVLCLGMVAFGVCLPLQNLLVMSGRPYLALVDNGLWLVGLLGLSVWLVPGHGGMGAAWASALSLLVVTAVLVAQAWRCEGIWPFRLRQLKPVAASLVAVAVAWLARAASPLPPLVSLLPELLLFLVVLLLGLRGLGFEPEDRLLIAHLRQRLRPTRDVGPSEANP